uniref:Uncharacterized protein n=1 Tax=Theileria annulata TaxID=5874 RepID=A0A3B0MPC9_THEAN
MFISNTLLTSRQHGWRFEKLRPKFKKWVRIDHPPQSRSNLIKLDDKYNKLMYVTNGRIIPQKREEFIKSGKHYVKKGSKVTNYII